MRHSTADRKGDFELALTINKYLISRADWLRSVDRRCDKVSVARLSTLRLKSAQPFPTAMNSAADIRIFLKFMRPSPTSTRVFNSLNSVSFAVNVSGYFLRSEGLKLWVKPGMPVIPVRALSAMLKL